MGTNQGYLLKYFLLYLSLEGIQIVKVIHSANGNFSISRFVIIEEIDAGLSYTKRQENRFSLTNKIK